MYSLAVAVVLCISICNQVHCFNRAPKLSVRRLSTFVNADGGGAESSPIGSDDSSKDIPVASEGETWTVRPDPGNALDLTEENVVKVLDEIRPYLQSDGGDVEVANINLVTRDIEVSLQGACGNCPSSTTTMKMGIERVLRENFDNLGSITALNLTEEGAPSEPLIDTELIEGTLKNILPAIQGMGGSVNVKSVEPGSGEVTVIYKGPARLRKGVELVLKDIKGVNTVTIEEEI